MSLFYNCRAKTNVSQYFRQIYLNEHGTSNILYYNEAEGTNQ